MATKSSKKVAPKKVAPKKPVQKAATKKAAPKKVVSHKEDFDKETQIVDNAQQVSDILKNKAVT